MTRAFGAGLLSLILLSSLTSTFAAEEINSPASEVLSKSSDTSVTETPNTLSTEGTPATPDSSAPTPQSEAASSQAPLISLPSTIPSINVEAQADSAPKQSTEESTPSTKTVMATSADFPEPEEEEAPLPTKDTKEQVKFAGNYLKNYPFPLIAIRFPSDYEINFAGDLVPLKGFKKTTKATLEELVNEQVVKSTYLACDFYQHLKHRLPHHSIILVPCKLKYEKGQVVSEPICKPLPALLDLDFFAEINPKRLQNPSSNLGGDDTFGTHLRMFLTVSALQNGTRKLIAGHPVMDPASNQVGTTIETFYNNIYNGGKLKSVSIVDGLPVSSKPLYEPGSFMALHSEFSCPSKSVLLQADANPGRVESAACKAWNYFGNILIGALNTQDLEKSREMLLCETVSDVAPEIKEIILKTSAQADTPLAKKKVSYFSNFVANERQRVFGLQTDELMNKIWKDKFGSSVREQFKSELTFAKQCAASKRRQVGAGLMGLASLGGAVATAITVPSVPVSGLLAGLTVSAVSMVANEATLQKQLRESIKELSAKLDNIEVGFLLALDTDVIEVQATKIEKLPIVMKQIYKQKFVDAPSMP